MGNTTNGNLKIEHPFLILCEGIDEKNFLIWYLNSNELSNDPFFSQDIQIIDFGGNEALEKQISAYRLLPGFSNVETLMIIRDSETNVETAIHQVGTALSHNGFLPPPQPGIWQSVTSDEGKLKRLGFLLFPSCDASPVNGTLEDLCLSIIKEDMAQNIMKHVDSFMSKLENDNIRTFPHRHKSKLHTYFSVTDEFVSFKIGEAAKAGAFDWSSEKLNPLKSFLLEAKE